MIAGQLPDGAAYHSLRCIFSWERTQLVCGMSLCGDGRTDLARVWRECPALPTPCRLATLPCLIPATREVGQLD